MGGWVRSLLRLHVRLFPRFGYHTHPTSASTVLVCLGLHSTPPPTPPRLLQLAVASPLAATSPSSEPQYVTVYDMEHGNATWQLPLQAGPDALQPLPSAAAALAGGAGASDNGGVSTARPAMPAAAALAGLLRGLTQSGVAAVQFSPQVVVCRAPVGIEQRDRWRGVEGRPTGRI
jgi:hypothetical protein